MLDWDALLQHMMFDDIDEPVDHAFIVDFLSRYFPDKAPAELSAKLFEVIGAEGMKGTRQMQAKVRVKCASAIHDL